MAHDAADQPALGVVAIGSVVGRERTQLDGSPGRNPKRVYATCLFEQLCDVAAFPGDADPDPLVFHLNDPSIVERALDHPVYHTSRSWYQAIEIPRSALRGGIVLEKSTPQFFPLCPAGESDSLYDDLKRYNFCPCERTARGYKGSCVRSEQERNVENRNGYAQGVEILTGRLA